MSYKQSDCLISATKRDRDRINAGERWIMAIVITLLLLAYQISLSQPTIPDLNSNSLPVQTPNQIATGD